MPFLLGGAFYFSGYVSACVCGGGHFSGIFAGSLSGSFEMNICVWWGFSGRAYSLGGKARISPICNLCIFWCGVAFFFSV